MVNTIENANEFIAPIAQNPFETITELAARHDWVAERFTNHATVRLCRNFVTTSFANCDCAWLTGGCRCAG